MQQVKAVIVREKDAPAELTTITVPDPGPGEALVKVLTCGVCQTDMHYQKGGVGDDFPYLLGHEASGIVEAVGEDVTGVAVGGVSSARQELVGTRARLVRFGAAGLVGLLQLGGHGPAALGEQLGSPQRSPGPKIWQW